VCDIKNTTTVTVCLPLAMFEGVRFVLDMSTIEDLEVIAVRCVF